MLDALDPELFRTCFVSWAEALREHEPDIAAIDGKLAAWNPDYLETLLRQSA